MTTNHDQPNGLRLQQREAFSERFRWNHAMARERHRARLWGLFYVRGAMDPSYTSPAARDAYVADLLNVRANDLAVAFMRGWVEHHPDPLACCCQHHHGEPAWDEEQGRWRYPVRLNWSYACPVERHRIYAAAMDAYSIPRTFMAGVSA